LAKEIVDRTVEADSRGFEARDAFVGDLEIGGGLHQSIVSPVKEVFAEGGESPSDLCELFGRLFFPAVGLDEALLEGFVLLLKLDNRLLQLRGAGGLGATHPDGGRKPESGGDCLEKECVTERHRVGLL